MRYPKGAPVRLSFEVRDVDRMLSNPTDISLRVMKPDGTFLDYTSGQLTQDSVGLYRIDLAAVVLDQLGHYVYILTTTGVAAGVLADEFDIFDPFELRILSLSEAKGSLDIPRTDTAEDDELQEWINTVDEVIEHILGGPLLNTSVTERATAMHDNTVLAVRKRPLVSVEAIVDTASSQSQPVGDLDIDYNAGLIRRRLNQSFTGYGPSYRITYTAGWGRTVSSPAKQAAKLILAHLWQTTRGPSTSNTRPSFGGADTITVPGTAYAVPNRAVELLGGQAQEAHV